MTNKQLSRTGLALSILVGLAACGGGGGGSAPPSTQSSSKGIITAFGSIYVNGTEYNTGNAAIYVEDSPADESQLRVGMVVRVVEDGSGNAVAVYHDDELEGIVLSNSIAAGQSVGTLNIMGQTVTVDVNTVFESDVASITSVAAIAAGNIVEVSGYGSGTGTVTATRIEVKAVDLASYLTSHPEGIEVKGIVANHNATNKTFALGSLTVVYTNATLSDLPNGITNNIYVEVKSTAGLNASNQLVASRVELENNGHYDEDGDDGDEYELTGKVMAVNATSITVNGQTFLVNNTTEVEHGLMSAVTVGTLVEVEGRFNAAGELVATKIEIEDDHPAATHLTGTVASIVIDGNNLGTITLTNSNVIKVNNRTVMHDSSVTTDRTFNLTDLVAGNYLEIHAYANGDGTYTAIKLEREDMPSPPPAPQV